MTQPPYSLSSVLPVSKPPRPVWIVPVIAGLVVLVLAAGGLAAWALTRPAVTAGGVGALHVVGSVTLWTSSGVQNEGAGHCSGMGGYDDLHAGTQLTVTDQASSIIGVTTLDRGEMFGGGSTRSCRFGFTVDVPAGKAFYGLEIARRGRVQYTEAELATGPGLSLGR